MGDTVGNLIGGSPSTPNLQTWQPGYTKQADPLFYNTISQQVGANPYQQYQGVAQGILGQQLNNPYAQGYQNAGNQAGGYYGQTGQQDFANSQALGNTVGQNIGYGNQVAQMGFDPQSALYNRTLQQMQDQVRTSNAARGINSSGYGADLENQATSNFNIDWQGQQLNRALAGLGGYNSATANAANTGKTASNLGVAGAGAAQQGGYTPYGVYSDILNNKSGALSTYGGQQLQGQAQQNNNLGQLLQYLGLGAQQSNAQAGLNQQNYLNQLQQSQAFGSNLGGLFSGAGALMI